MMIPNESSVCCDCVSRGRRIGFLLLLSWGVFPIGLSVRALDSAASNLRHVGHFYSGLLWDGLVEYILLATWIVAVALYWQRHPSARLTRMLAFIPATLATLLAVHSIAQQLTAGGAFYLPDVVARGDTSEFLVFHSLYASVFIPLAAYAAWIVADGVRVFRSEG